MKSSLVEIIVLSREYSLEFEKLTKPIATAAWNN